MENSGQALDPSHPKVVRNTLNYHFFDIAPKIEDMQIILEICYVYVNSHWFFVLL